MRAVLPFVMLTFAVPCVAHAEDEVSCSSGTKEEVVRCWRPKCRGQIWERTPASLRKIGWRVIQCDQEPQTSAFTSEVRGLVRLYRETSGRLRWAQDLTQLGADTAKWYVDEFFEITGVAVEKVGSRRVLRLAWSLFEGRERALRLDQITFCLLDEPAESACPATVAAGARIRGREDPEVETSPIRTSEVSYEVRLTDNAVVVKIAKLRLEGREPCRSPP
jgi:hypothetical protein